MKVVDVQARDGFLIYTTAARKVSADTEAAFLVRSLPLSQIGTEATQSVLLYQDDAGLVGVAGVQSWNLGSHLLAFSKSGQLSVTSYRGAGTIVLDNDATLLTGSSTHSREVAMSSLTRFLQVCRCSLSPSRLYAQYNFSRSARAID